MTCLSQCENYLKTGIDGDMTDDTLYQVEQCRCADFCHSEKAIVMEDNMHRNKRRRKRLEKITVYAVCYGVQRKRRRVVVQRTLRVLWRAG